MEKERRTTKKKSIKKTSCIFPSTYRRGAVGQEVRRRCRACQGIVPAELDAFETRSELSDCVRGSASSASSCSGSSGAGEHRLGARAEHRRQAREGRGVEPDVAPCCRGRGSLCALTSRAREGSRQG